MRTEMVQRAAIYALLGLLLAAQSNSSDNSNQYLYHNITETDDAGGSSVLDRYVASFANDATCQQEYDQLHAEYNSSSLGDDYPANMTFNTNGINVFEVVIYSPTDDQLATVEKLDCVIDLSQDSISMHAVSPGSEVPLSWGLDRINQRDLPLDNLYSWGYNASNSVVFVIDTGVNGDHPDWLPGQVQFGADCVTATCQTSNDPGDPAGHGTHVAGTVACPSYGVAKGATVISIRVLDAFGSGSWAGVVSGIVWATNYAATNTGRRYVINMSIGGGYSASVNQAVDDASAAGIVVVVAAGNEGADACSSSPSGAVTAVTVGATTSMDAAAWWSNWGACVNIYAPGLDITSLNSNYTVDYSRILSGTSMASPHVAGAVAQILDLHPMMTVDEAIMELLCDATRDVIAEPLFSVNALLYNSEFDFVNSSCPTLPPFPTPPWGNCTGNIGWIGDGWCDSLNNNEDCDWDGGDCCESTCDPNALWECGIDGYDCQDPDAPPVSPTPTPTNDPTPTPTNDPYPDCVVDTPSWLGDGWCDGLQYNVEECGYDGGDCCEDTCDPNAEYECCVNAPCDCEDPDSIYGPQPPSPAPAPPPAPDCPLEATVTGSSIPRYWADLAVSVGLDLNHVGFNTICELWMYDNVSTCIGWGEFNDNTCYHGEEVCCGADGSTYGTGIAQVSHVAEMVGLGDDQHYLCPVCPPPPPGHVNKCHEGQLHEFREEDTIPEHYEDPGSISGLYPATWIACDCEMHHVGHHLINESYWWNQATLTTPPLDPSLITYFDDGWGPAWYYSEVYTCVGMGPYASMCPLMLFCGGGPSSSNPAAPGKTSAQTYGSAADQMGGIVDARYNGGTHADCGYSFVP